MSAKLRIALCVLLLPIALGFALMIWIGDGWFYFPNDHVYGAAADYGVVAEDVTFAAPDGPQLHGWWLPAQGEHKGTVVYCHGNAANLTLHARYVAWLPARGYAVLVFDYRGFGRSDGTVSRAGTVDDAVAAIDLALARDPDRTVVFGHSLGGAVGIAAAARRKAVRGVIAESTFSDYREIARSKAPWLAALVPLFVSDGHDPVDVLADLPPAPLLVIHGERDHIVPVRFGRQLFERASEPKELWLVPEAAHFSPWTVRRAEFERRFEDFFAKALAAERRR
ncbi:MAG: alpha/beta hydrolase [Planctomycetes bacterium]|nr:alpha/beta hydrolase [Planctomycetota bacterium]